MHDETALVRQWLPLGLMAARRVASHYRASEQERADLNELVPVALWERIRDGSLTADTPTALAVCVVVRNLVRHIYEWRPGTYKASGAKTGGRRKYLRRPVNVFADVFEDGEPDPDTMHSRTTVEATDPAALASRLAAIAGLTDVECEALASRASTERQVDLASRRGTTRQAVQTSQRNAFAKLRAHERAVVAELTR